MFEYKLIYDYLQINIFLDLITIEQKKNPHTL